MPDGLLGILKLCLLALLYLFFLRVMWAVWREVRAPEAASLDLTTIAAPLPPPKPSRRERRQQRRMSKDHHHPELLVVSGPGAGTVFPIDGELTIGRSPGCTIRLDDTFVSQLHARVFIDGDIVCVDDLGSTNGTLVNGNTVVSGSPLHVGDELRVGETTMELR